MSHASLPDPDACWTPVGPGGTVLCVDLQQEMLDHARRRLDNVQVVAKERLLSRIGTLKPRRIDEVKRALGFSLDWPELKGV